MTHTVQDIAKRYAVGEHTVLGWINSGELRAINVARQQGTRPKYRIDQDGLDAFERLRSNTPEPERKRTRKKQTADVIDRY